jgi:hypothetical protein
MRHHMFRVALAAFAASVVLGHGAALAASAEKGKAAFVKFGCWGPRIIAPERQVLRIYP